MVFFSQIRKQNTVKHLIVAQLLLVFFILPGCNSNDSHPLLNGTITDEEWSNSKLVNIDEDYVMYLKEDWQYYYLAIESKINHPFYLDIFINNAKDTVINIHASSQLGERKLTGTAWDDRTPATKWGFINDWNANSVKFDNEKIVKLKTDKFEGNIFAETVMFNDGFEFQFSKNTWNLENVLFRVEIRNMVNLDSFKEIVFPENTTRFEYDNWHKLVF